MTNNFELEWMEYLLRHALLFVYVHVPCFFSGGLCDWCLMSSCAVKLYRIIVDYLSN